MGRVENKGWDAGDLINNAGTLTAMAGSLLVGAGAFLRWLFGMHRRHVAMEIKLDELGERMDKMELRSELRAEENRQLMDGVSRIKELLEGGS